ncbi:CBS domain-containing protein [Pedobacter cryophilus]|uniref:CBS domain-containing protein n=1 Tax=Pedobacter cryophilus TaxID=2571271 RepID=A0A4U1C6K6_9SPHI|nr:CBS domain-containing protein [Pedobacter cryophilus]TKC01049.1 CBS domain-containing protein [Pedobacter cryophilus]
MIKVHQILKQKEIRLITISSKSMVFEALQNMMEFNISAILIVDEGQLTGIFTERDYARKVVLLGKSSKEVQIKEVMTPSPIVISPEDSLDHCMQLMTDKHIRHLPVMYNGQLTGMVSIGDVVKFIIEDQKQTIKNLETYISS